jgi:hypothetical protein
MNIEKFMYTYIYIYTDKGMDTNKFDIPRHKYGFVYGLLLGHGHGHEHTEVHI